MQHTSPYHSSTSLTYSLFELYPDQDAEARFCPTQTLGDSPHLLALSASLSCSQMQWLIQLFRGHAKQYYKNLYQRYPFWHTPELPWQDPHPIPSQEFLQQAAKLHIEHLNTLQGNDCCHGILLPSCSQVWQCLILPRRLQAVSGGCVHLEWC